MVCDRRNDMGRVKVPLARLKQWQVTQAQIARWVSEELGLTLKSYNPTNIGTIKLGNLRHGGRLSSVEFHSDEPVRLTISGSALPLTEIVFLEDGRLQIDQVAIAHIVGQAHAPTRSGRRKPSTARRDARKLDTAARHQSWRKEARELRRAHRDKSERWIAQRIAKLPIADGASWETIRKNIRK